MAIDLTASDAKRRNVLPVSSTLNIATRDIDCSGMAQSPEDGEFVPQTGSPASANPGDSSADNAFHGADASVVLAQPQQATSLAMVWGSARRGDRQALGDQAVPVLMHGGVEVECKLFNCDDGVALLTQYPIGSRVSVAPAASVISAVAGDTATAGAKRLVLSPMANDDVGYAVGYVTATKSAGTFAAAGDTVTVYLYDKPQAVSAVI
jgi:hypothetical protein